MNSFVVHFRPISSGMDRAIEALRDADVRVGEPHAAIRLARHGVEPPVRVAAGIRLAAAQGVNDFLGGLDQRRGQFGIAQANLGSGTHTIKLVDPANCPAIPDVQVTCP